MPAVTLPPMIQPPPVVAATAAPGGAGVAAGTGRGIRSGRWYRRLPGGLLAAALLVLSSTAAGAGALDPAEAMKRSEAAIGRVIGGYTLTEANGNPLPIEALRGRPLIVSLIYTSCGTVCPIGTRRLEDAVQQANRAIGSGRFNVLTVGFDARHDTPRRVAEFAAANGVRAANWRFASADAATLDRLLDDLGFSYAAIAGGFEHISQTTILDAEGRIRRHVYGDEFPVQMLLEPLKDVVYGRSLTSLTVEGLIDRIRFLCTAYDPRAGHYRVSYGMIVGSILGAITLIFSFALLMREWRRSGQPRPTA